MFGFVKPVWISEQEAVDMLGLDNARTLRRLIKNGRLSITWTQVTQKSARRFNKLDVDRALLQHSNMVA